MHPQQDEINALLTRIEADHGVRILYACESGSRAWGFASPDSDYDIRFIFRRAMADYMGIVPCQDAFDVPIEDDLDAGGWDVRKALGLMGKSNGPLLEWLHSPVVYREEEGFLDRWRTTAQEVFVPDASIYHYKGLAKQMVMGKLQDEQVRAKDYLYALRSILAAKWVQEKGTIPPVPFAEVLAVAPEAIQQQVPDLLEHKARTLEGDTMPRVPELDAFLESELESRPDPSAKSQTHPDAMPALDRLFRREVFGVKPEKVEDFDLQRVRRPDVLLFDSVAGSQAYGTAVEGSDEDRRGVFLAPPGFRLGLDAIEQVSDERNDEVYYELGRFVELLLKNNPNALELLGMPEDCVRHRHPLYDKLKPEIFLSKLCHKTFGEYAMGQIRKARGLNKKIVNPQPEERRSLLSFCHVPEGQGSVPVLEWLEAKGIDPWSCSLTAVKNAAGLHAIYQLDGAESRGLVSRKDPDRLVYSSVPKEAEPMTWMHCNEDAFKAHCKAHREYWEWVGNRNEERYATNVSHGRGYDSKNLMHTLRLLDMAEEIAREGVLRVRRSNRDFLLQIRAGEYTYDWLVERAEEQHAGLAEANAPSDLPEAPDREVVHALLIEMRATGMA